MLKLSKLFSNGMVMEKNGRIWGSAESFAQIDFRFQNQHETLTADADGNFRTSLKSADYGGPYEMKIGEVTLADVYIGRVWLCGGQSNMETPLSRTRVLLDEFITDEPRIRMFNQAKSYAIGGTERESRDKAEGEWISAEGEALDNFSAVPYFFAKELLEHKDIPIGLVCIGAGGTSAEAWLPEEEANKFARHRESLAYWKNPERVRQTEKEGAEREADWSAKLNERDEGIKGNWKDSSFDDSGWKNASAITDTDGFPAHGSVWLRKKIFLREPPKKKSEPQGCRLSLGRAVDSVTVFVNGNQVINIGYQYPPCRGEVPAETLKQGENVIAVRLVGSGGSPCFIPDKPYELACGNERMDLLNGWKYKTGCETDRLEPSFWFYEVPTAVYYTMLAPVLDYSYEGVIWYQGESNIAHPEDYVGLFSAFAGNLRKVNGENLPLIFTQLARYDDPSDPGNLRFDAFREEQRKCLAIPNSGMADAYDCGEWNDLHPLDKRTVGKRLAKLAR